MNDISPNSQFSEEKKENVGEEPKTITPKDNLLEIAQLSRKIAYWLDDDTELPNGFINLISVIGNKLKQMDKYINDQMIDVSDNINEEVKSVPTKPEVWSRIKKSTLEKSGKKELGKVSTWLASKEYKDKGGKWRKKKRNKSADK